VLTIATAGHIDHGKSSLIKALTAIDPDRLPEEKERGMTIDLGFAWLPLPSGEVVGMVDVPGHKQFVHNVIPGLFGVDAALLVVAADDGWMPQTEEHLRILDLLGIRHGLVVLNKIDLVPDRAWLDLVSDDIAQHLTGTSLDGSPILRVSARTGDGLEEMRRAVTDLTARLAPRRDVGKPRLPVDRVFSIKGAGVVVTGTLSGGIFRVGEDVALSPAGLPARIRAVESYKQLQPEAMPGSRVALNLSGIKQEEIKRGDLVLPVEMPISRVLDVELKLLPGLEAPLKNMAEVVVFIETREMLGRVALIGPRFLAPGESTYAQLRLSEDVSAYIGERYVIRQQSPPLTIGGGVILDPQAEKFKIVGVSVRQAFLGKRRTLGLPDLILSEVEKRHQVMAGSMLSASFFSKEEIDREVKELLRQRRLATAGQFLVDILFWQDVGGRLLSVAKAEHEADRSKKGMPQAVAQNALGLEKDVFDALVQELVSAGKLVRLEDALALPEHRQQLSSQQEVQAKAIRLMFQKNPKAPPTLKEVTAEILGSVGVVRYLAQQGELVELPEGVLMTAAQFGAVETEVVRLLKDKGKVTIQDLSSCFGFSRKYSIPIFTQLDRLGITRREGDVRVAGKKTAG